MNIQNHNIIFINDENNEDIVGSFLTRLQDDSIHSEDDKLHLIFLQSAFNLLGTRPLDELINKKTELTVTIDGFQKTKSYGLIKPLRVNPIYELRYAKNDNEHVRFLFFPIIYKGISYYVFVKAFVKTRKPSVDDTDMMRDLTYKMYRKVIQNPEYYLEGIE